MSEKTDPYPQVAGENMRLREAIHISAMYLRSGHIECTQCGAQVPTAHTDAEHTLRAALDDAASRRGGGDIAFAVDRMREGLAVRQRKWPAGWHLSIVRPGLMLDLHSGQDVDALPFLAFRMAGAMTPHLLSALDVLSTDWELFTPETEGTA